MQAGTDPENGDGQAVFPLHHHLMGTFKRNRDSGHPAILSALERVQDDLERGRKRRETYIDELLGPKAERAATSEKAKLLVKSVPPAARSKAS